MKRTNRNVLKLNTVFRTENIKDISDQVHHTGEYSDYESDDSVHYPPVDERVYQLKKIKGIQRKKQERKFQRKN